MPAGRPRPARTSGERRPLPGQRATTAGGTAERAADWRPASSRSAWTSVATLQAATAWSGPPRKRPSLRREMIVQLPSRSSTPGPRPSSSLAATLTLARRARLYEPLALREAHPQGRGGLAADRRRHRQGHLVQRVPAAHVPRGPFHDNTSFLDNPELRPEKVSSLELDYEHRFGKKASSRSTCSGTVQRPHRATRPCPLPASAARRIPEPHGLPAARHEHRRARPAGRRAPLTLRFAEVLQAQGGVSVQRISGQSAELPRALREPGALFPRRLQCPSSSRSARRTLSARNKDHLGDARAAGLGSPPRSRSRCTPPSTCPASPGLA